MRKTPFKSITDEFEPKLAKLEVLSERGDKKAEKQFAELLIKYCQRLLKFPRFQEQSSHTDTDEIVSKVFIVRKIGAQKNRFFHRDIYNAIRQEGAADKKEDRKINRLKAHISTTASNESETERHGSHLPKDHEKGKAAIEFLTSDLEITDEVMLFCYSMAANKYVYGTILPPFKITRNANLKELKNNLIKIHPEIGTLLVTELTKKSRSSRLLHGKTADVELILIEIMLQTFIASKELIAHLPELNSLLRDQIFIAAKLTLKSKYTSAKSQILFDLHKIDGFFVKLVKCSKFLKEDRTWNPQLDPEAVIGIIRAKLYDKAKGLTNAIKKVEDDRTPVQYVQQLIQTLLESEHTEVPKRIMNEMQMMHDVSSKVDATFELIELGDFAIPTIIETLKKYPRLDVQIILFNLLRKMNSGKKTAIPFLEEFIQNHPDNSAESSSIVLDQARIALKRLKTRLRD